MSPDAGSARCIGAGTRAWARAPWPPAKWGPWRTEGVIALARTARYRQSVRMSSPPKPFIVALVTYTVSSAIGLGFGSRDDPSNEGSVAGGAALAATIAAILWFFAARRHRWPKWCLLLLLVIAIGAHVAFLDLRSLLATLDVVALAVLLRGWSSIEQQEKGHLGTT